MRADIPAPADSTLQSRSAVITLYPTASPRDLVVGTSGLATFDLTPYAQQPRHTDSEASILLRYHTELAGASRPKPGQVVRITVGSYAVFTGQIDSISGETEWRGERSMTITVRRRDATKWWRDQRRMTDIYSVGSDLSLMARDVALNLGLTADEYNLPPMGVALAHESAQLGDMNAWAMLTTILQPALLAPFVDGRGVLKYISRRVSREPDLTLASAQVAKITNQLSVAPLTTMRVKWMDPGLTLITQQEQTLAQGQLTCGFFKQHSQLEVWWSQDHRQRAKNTRLVVKNSINAGAIGPIGSESYVDTSLYGGVIHADLDAGWFALEVGAAIAGLAAGAALPDNVVVAGLGASTGVTVPIGRIAHNISLMALLWVITRIGHGIYEIRGQPYDYVHAINEVEAYDENAPAWMETLEELQNDLVPNASAAQALAVGELVYRARSASKAGLLIADDLRIEPGDLIGLWDGRKFYVESLSRDLTRGAEATLSLSGFFA